MHSNMIASVLLAATAMAAPALEDRSTGGRVNDPNIANFNNGNIHDGIGKGRDEYRMYWGNGSPSQGWPGKDRWVSFEDMFNANKGNMFVSCDAFSVPRNTGQEIGAIWNAIQKIGDETGVDHRLILAIIMQESTGCVRVWTTGGANHRNPGLMQDHNGSGTCNENGVRKPCPDGIIELMIREGTAGTRDGDGVAQCLNQAGTSDVSAFYRAAHIYNSGDTSNLDHLEGSGTRCYASDVANRLTGWVNADHGCNLDG